MTWPLLYRKPECLCRIDPELETILEADRVLQFANLAQDRLVDEARRAGLRLRRAVSGDMDLITDLLGRCFLPDTPSLENQYSLHLILTYGYAAVLESPGGRLEGCNICAGYDDPDRTAFGIRVAVDQAAGGRNLGALLVSYTSLEGMKRGARLRRGLLSPTNFGSGANFLNHVGYLGESYHPCLPSFGPRFVVVLPLTPAGIGNNRIDQEKMLEFIDQGEPEKDYRLIDCENLDLISDTYNNTDFRVAAFVKKGMLSDRNQLLALAKSALRFPEAPKKN
ncbi:MAG: hypothetical protein V1816_01680 [Pseudomonadota bacterium]